MVAPAIMPGKPNEATLLNLIKPLLFNIFIFRTVVFQAI